MARGVNKVILVGTCGQDPEVRYLPNGNAVTNLSLATSEQWNDKQSGQKVERTCLLYTSPSPRDRQKSRMPSSA